MRRRVIVLVTRAIEVNRPYLGRRMFGACSRFIGVGRSTFLLFQRHEFHPAFRTIAGMIAYDFGMHRARVFLSLLVLVLVLAMWAIGVNRPYLCNRDERHRAPNFSFGRKQLRVEFCSIVTARAPAFALPVWNGTGTRFAPNRSSSPPQRMRNDSRSQARNRSQSRRPRTA